MRRIPLLLAAATLLPIGVLSWLGIRIIQQDREVEQQRRREALEVAAGRLALDIGRRLQDIEDQLAKGTGIALAAPTDEEPPASLFSEGEAAEFARKDFSTAAAAYRVLAQSLNPPVRAAALVRLGRVLRQLGDREGALQAYSGLEQLSSLTVGGMPADLIGWQGRCRVLEEAHDVQGLRIHAARLAQALESGRWPLDKSTFEVYREMVQGWGATPPSAARTEAALQLRTGDLGARGRRILREDSGAVLAVWSNGRAWLGGSDEIARLSGTPSYAVAVYDTEGQLIAGSRSQGGVSLTPGETRLPFILSISSNSETAANGRGVLISGLALAFLAMLGAGYGLYRATTREIMLARQQSDFVSAVSHEFRTPLTSMRHLTDMLVSRTSISEERKTQYYELLAHETERLHRMVESLLSFGRIEVGAYAWRLEPSDAAGLLRGIVEEFRREPQVRDRVVTVEIDDALPEIHADARRCRALYGTCWKTPPSTRRRAARFAFLRAGRKVRYCWVWKMRAPVSRPPNGKRSFRSSCAERTPHELVFAA